MMEWPESSFWCNDFRKICGRDVIVVPYPRTAIVGGQWSSPTCDDELNGGEWLEITTDPDDAPADCEKFLTHRQEGLVARALVGMVESISALATACARAPCPRCNGTGQVHGALGVGIMWPCECQGGA